MVPGAGIEPARPPYLGGALAVYKAAALTISYPGNVKHAPGRYSERRALNWTQVATLSSQFHKLNAPRMRGVSGSLGRPPVFNYPSRITSILLEIVAQPYCPAC